jgi:HEAT repeat protein
MTFAADKDPTVRLGVVWELRPIAPAIEEAQQCLATLSKDADPKVAEAARQALVQAGGRYAIPYLLETIEDTASTGSKLGDVALQRAIECDDPGIVPVLAKALQVRSKASAGTIKQILERLGQFGDASCLPAVEPFTKSADAGVAQTAKAVIDEIKACQQ